MLNIEQKAIVALTDLYVSFRLSTGQGNYLKIGSNLWNIANICHGGGDMQ